MEYGYTVAPTNVTAAIVTMDMAKGQGETATMSCILGVLRLAHCDVVCHQAETAS